MVKPASYCSASDRRPPLELAPSRYNPSRCLPGSSHTSVLRITGSNTADATPQPDHDCGADLVSASGAQDDGRLRAARADGPLSGAPGGVRAAVPVARGPWRADRRRFPVRRRLRRGAPDAGPAAGAVGPPGRRHGHSACGAGEPGCARGRPAGRRDPRRAQPRHRRVGGPARPHDGRPRRSNRDLAAGVSHRASRTTRGDAAARRRHRGGRSARPAVGMDEPPGGPRGMAEAAPRPDHPADRLHRRRARAVPAAEPRHDGGAHDRRAHAVRRRRQRIALRRGAPPAGVARRHDAVLAGSPPRSPFRSRGSRSCISRHAASGSRAGRGCTPCPSWPPRR